MKTRTEWLELVRRDYSHLGSAEHERIVDEILATHPDHVPLPKLPHSDVPQVNMRPIVRILWIIVALLSLIALSSLRAHAQGKDSQIYTIGWQNQGVSIGTFAGPFKVNFTGVGVSCARSGSLVTCTVTGGTVTNNPGGSSGQVQYNSSAAFGGISTFTTTGTVNTALGGSDWLFADPTDATKKASFDVSAISTATTRTFKFPNVTGDSFVVSTNAVTSDCVPIGNSDGSTTCGDPLVQGTQAAASTTIPNPVVIGGSDFGGTPAVRVTKVDSSGQLYIGNFPTSFNVGNFPATQPVSSTQLPAALDGSGFLKTHEQGTAAISAASLPLPSGAATSAKQPALGTAGTASSDVLTVQGIASMTALKIDGSAVTQPVSGTVTANAGTNLNTSALALETGGNLAQIATNTVNPGCAGATIALTQTFAINNAASGNTQILALSSGKVIYVCSFSIQVGSTNTAKLVYGTGTACATGQTDITGPYGGAAQSGVAMGNGVGVLGKTAASNALCINNSAANQVSGQVTVAQF